MHKTAPVLQARSEKEQEAAVKLLATYVLNDAAALLANDAIMAEFREWQEAKKSKKINRLKNRLNDYQNK